MILSIMYYFTNFGDLCDSGSFHLYGFPGSTTHYDKKFILLLLTSFISKLNYSNSSYYSSYVYMFATNLTNISSILDVYYPNNLLLDILVMSI